MPISRRCTQDKVQRDRFVNNLPCMHCSPVVGAKCAIHHIPVQSQTDLEGEVRNTNIQRKHSRCRYSLCGV